MLIDEIEKKINFHSMNGSSGEVCVNNEGNIAFTIKIILNETLHVITLFDELINFIPLFYFQLPKTEQEVWDCIIFIDNSVVSGLEPYSISSHLSKGRLLLNIDNVTYIYDISKLMISKKVLGESIFNSLKKQAEYLES